MNYALTMYPLSGGFRGRLKEALAGDPIYLSMADFRRRPIKDTVGQLRNLNGARLVLPIEDENSRSVLPILTAVAALSNAGPIEIRYADMRAEPIARWDVWHSLASVVSASARGVRDAATCRAELQRLVRSPRIPARFSSDLQHSLYLNANLWFGVKAGGSIGHVAGVVNALRARLAGVTYASAGNPTMIDRRVDAITLAPPEIFGFPPELNHYTFHRLVDRQLRSLNRPDFIYQRMSLGNYTGVVRSRAWGVPLVLEYNGSEVWIARQWGRRLWYETLASKAEEASLRHAHVIVTISDVLRDELLERGVEADRIVSYPNCIDPALFDPARFSTNDVQALRRKLGADAGSVVATFVGTFGQWHGVDVLAQAIRAMVDQDAEWLRRKRLRFVLVGDGVKMSIVRETLGDACGDFVTLTGLVPQAEAPSYLAASDLLLSPHVANQDGSRFFGSPTKLFEYMAMGKAIVASDLDQIGEVLKNSVRLDAPVASPPPGDSRLAVLCRPGDVSDLVTAIRFAVDNPEWRRTLGANVRAEALAKYTWPHHVSAILDRLQSVS